MVLHPVVVGGAVLALAQLVKKLVTGLVEPQAPGVELHLTPHLFQALPVLRLGDRLRVRLPGRLGRDQLGPAEQGGAGGPAPGLHLRLARLGEGPVQVDVDAGQDPGLQAGPPLPGGARHQESGGTW